MNFKFVILAALLLALTGGAAFALASPSSPDIGALESLSPVYAAPIVTWKGSHDNHWSNPANWEGGRVPGAADVAQFSGGADSGVLVDADSPGTVAGLILKADFRGVLRLGRDLTVSDQLVIAGGTLDQGDFPLSVKRYLQTGGQLIGGGSSLTIQDAAIVRGGTLLTSKTMSAAALTIEAPAVVTMATNSKLSLTGDGEPLNGDGLLDVIRNRPNSLEYTGQTTADVTEATPLRGGALGMAAPSRSQIISRFQNQAS